VNRPDKTAVWNDIESMRPLDAQEFDRIRQLARQSFGLDLKPGKEELVSSRLQRLVRDGGFRSFHDYYHHIVDDTTGFALASMIDALATNHTAFYREPDHFEFLRAEVLPDLARRGGADIWSAACSTGEEAWTLAFVLNDALPSRRIQVVASDISNRALHMAERAVYTAERCQGIPESSLARYFDPADGQGSRRIAAKIRAQVAA
jgi:chemotaxis protein methyltransferase CheR